MDSDPVHLGLIGCGRITQVAHLPALEKADGIVPVALADPSEALRQGVGDRFGIGARYATSEELLNDSNVEAVLIAAPDRFHFDIARRALEQGIDVLVEKPLAASVAESERLVEIAKSTGRVLQVGAMKRHDPGMQYVKAAIGDIGRVLSFNTWYRVPILRPGIERTLFPPVTQDPEVRATENAVKAERTKYLLWTHSAHVFDSVRYLVGDVDGVTAARSNVGEEYAWQGVLRLVDGGIGTFELTVNTHGEWAEGFHINGEHGSVHIDTHFPFFRRASTVRVYTDATQAWTEPIFDDTNAYERQLESFARAVRGAESATPGPEDGLAVVRLIEAIVAALELPERRMVTW